MVVNEEDARYELKIRQIHSAAVEDDQLDRLGAFSLVGVEHDGKVGWDRDRCVDRVARLRIIQ